MCVADFADSGFVDRDGEDWNGDVYKYGSIPALNILTLTALSALPVAGRVSDGFTLADLTAARLALAGQDLGTTYDSKPAEKYCVYKQIPNPTPAPSKAPTVSPTTVSPTQAEGAPTRKPVVTPMPTTSAPTPSPTPAPRIKLLLKLKTKMSGITCDMFNGNPAFAVAFKANTLAMLTTLDDIENIVCAGVSARRALLSAGSVELGYDGVALGDVGETDADSLVTSIKAALTTQAAAGVSSYASALAAGFTAVDNSVVPVVDEAAVTTSVDEADATVVFTTPSPSKAPTALPTPSPSSLPTSIAGGSKSSSSDSDSTVMIIIIVVVVGGVLCIAGAVFMFMQKKGSGGSDAKVNVEASY